MDYSKDYDIPDDVTKDTSWQRLQKIQDSLGVSLIKVEAHRDELEREIKEISCELDKQASALNGLPFNKNGANYKEMDVKLKKTQKRFIAVRH